MLVSVELKHFIGSNIIFLAAMFFCSRLLCSRKKSNLSVRGIESRMPLFIPLYLTKRRVFLSVVIMIQETLAQKGKNQMSAW